MLEKDWGYVVQVIFDIYGDYGYLNEIFEKEGEIVLSLGMFDYDSGPVYRTEVHEATDSHERNHTVVHEASVRFRQLDDNHFIIPRTEEIGFGNALFFIDEENGVTYKGFIKGKIFGNILTENKRLLEQKQVLINKMSDETQGEDEYYFYSWDKNCRTSDKWSRLYSPENIEGVMNYLYNHMNHLPEEFISEMLRYMKENEAWLAALEINTEDNQHQRCFISLIGLNGLPLIDLTYITPTYEVKTHPLKKEEIGEVDHIKQWLKMEMEQQLLKIEENKRNIASNFFQMAGLTMNRSEGLIDEKEKKKKM